MLAGRLRPRVFLLLVLGALSTAAHCGPDRLGHWWRKEPLSDEEEFFARARDGPLSPEEPLELDTFVGWYGVLLRVEHVGELARLELDHRYASSLNLRFGVHDAASIHTVSLFGGGRFFLDANWIPAMEGWLPGELLCAYGTVRELAPIAVAAQYTRRYPRSAYEVEPLRPVRTADGKLVRSEVDGWTELELDPAVPSSATPIDAELRAALIERRPADQREELEIAYTLGELGGAEACAFLLSRLEAERDPERREFIAHALARAKGETGPVWDPAQPVPHWKDSPR